MIDESQEKTLVLLEDFSFIWASLHKTYNLSTEEMINMKSLLDDDVVNKGVGSMFGAFIGDSLGSYCEFRKNPFTFYDPELLLGIYSSISKPCKCLEKVLSISNQDNLLMILKWHHICFKLYPLLILRYH